MLFSNNGASLYLLCDVDWSLLVWGVRGAGVGGGGSFGRMCLILFYMLGIGMYLSRCRCFPGQSRWPVLPGSRVVGTV